MSLRCLFPTLLAFLMISGPVLAGNPDNPLVDQPVADLFELDEAGLEAEFGQLTQLEDHVLEHGGTLEEVLRRAVDGEFNGLITAEDPFPGSYRTSFLNMKPFLFGTVAACAGYTLGLSCLTGPAGVYYVWQDSNQDFRPTTDAFFGCILGNLPFTLYIAFLFASATI